MSYSDHQAFLRKRLYDNWQKTDIQWPNTDYKPAVGTPWLRASFQDGDNMTAGIGGEARLNRQVGVMYIQVFTPAGEGEGQAIDYAEEVRALFVSPPNTPSGLQFRSPASIKRVGNDGAWYQVNVLVPYESDTTD